MKAKLVNLPEKPGVYLLKDDTGKIIYVGKAKALSSRVRAWFQESDQLHPRSAALSDRITDFDILVTDNEMEALILEANLIKEHQPRYNVNLKDDKRYPYLKLTNEPFPRLLVVRRLKKDKAHYFGPYTDVKNMRRTLKTIGRIFQIRSCNLPLPPPPNRHFRVCLEYFIKRCPGPCEFKISSEAYKEMIDSVVLFLDGKSKQLVQQLRQRMQEYAKAEKFELAALVRDQLLAIESVVQKQKAIAPDQKDRDIIALSRSGKDACVVALQIREGRLLGRQTFFLTAEADLSDSLVLTAFLKQYFLRPTRLPEEVYLPGRPEDEQLIQGWLENKKGGKITLVFPQRGQKAKLLEMAEENARLSLNELLAQKCKAEKKVPEVVTLLKKDLRLDTLPRKIVAFDISNLQDSDSVGSMVFFEDGRPKKSGYRHFQIKTVVGQDDFAMMREVVTRYFSRLIEEKQSYPDLVLIDGGKGQLSAAIDSLTDLNIEGLAIIGLAKRLEEIILPSTTKALSIPKSSLSLRLLQRIRDEAHRFAVTYHRKRRTMRTIVSELDRIKGIGRARRQLLLTHFGSVDKMKAASLTELQAVPGLGKKTAETVYNHFQTTWGGKSTI